MATKHRIMLGAVQRHLKHKAMKAKYSAIYRKATQMAVDCGNPEIFKLVCEAIDVGSCGGIHSYYGSAPTSQQYSEGK